jgi:hypothetical protein
MYPKKPQQGIETSHFQYPLGSEKMSPMRRISIFREGNVMGAMIGPDLVIGLGGFGETVSDALRDLADGFDRLGYSLDENRVMVEVAGKVVSAEGQTPSDAIRKLAWVLGQRGYLERDYAALDWRRIASELPIVSL